MRQRLVKIGRTSREWGVASRKWQAQPSSVLAVHLHEPSRRKREPRLHRSAQNLTDLGPESVPKTPRPQKDPQDSSWLGRYGRNGCEGVSQRLKFSALPYGGHPAASATNQTKPGTVAVLDNIQFHHSKETMNAFSIMGIRPLFVPPYSPEFNFIENVFSLLKQVTQTSTRFSASCINSSFMGHCTSSPP